MPSAKDQYILAVDLGTTGAKVGLVSTSGEVIAHDFEKTQLFLTPNGGAEQDPDDWWRAMTTATRRLVARSTVPAEDIAALSCTTQWSGTVPVDGEGKHLMNAIIWMDSRGAEYVKNITSGLLTIEGYSIGKLLTWLRLTGGIPAHSGKDSIAHILYIKDQLPDIYHETYKFLEPKDYLNLRLTGRFAASYDSIALHWLTDNRDLTAVAYDDRLLAMSTLSREKLPELKRAVDVLGPIRPEAAQELGLCEDVQVIVGTPDVQSAAIGSGAVLDYEGHLYIGTSSWLTCHVPFKKTDIFHNMASLPSAVPDRYFVANEQESAGACLEFLRDNLLYPDDDLSVAEPPRDLYQRLDEIAADVPAGSGGLIFTPWLYGERTPVEDSSLRGGFHNVSLQSTRAHFIRAVYEGVAYNSRWLMGYVEKFIKRRMDAVNMVGGGAQSEAWCQIHADVLNRAVRQVERPILVNVRGAGLLAAVALGHMTFGDIPERVQIANTYRPNAKNRAMYDHMFEQFLEIYDKNRSIYATLNRGRR